MKFCSLVEGLKVMPKHSRLRNVGKAMLGTARAARDKSAAVIYVLTAQFPSISSRLGINRFPFYPLTPIIHSFFKIFNTFLLKVSKIKNKIPLTKNKRAPLLTKLHFRVIIHIQIHSIAYRFLSSRRQNISYTAV